MFCSYQIIFGNAQKPHLTNVLVVQYVGKPVLICLPAEWKPWYLAVSQTHSQPHSAEVIQNLQFISVLYYCFPIDITHILCIENADVTIN